MPLEEADVSKDGKIKEPQLASPKQTTTWQQSMNKKHICGSFGMQVGGCEIPIKFKINENCLKTVPHPGGRLAEHSPNTEQKCACSLWAQPGHSPTWPQPCNQLHLPWDPGGAISQKKTQEWSTGI